MSILARPARVNAPRGACGPRARAAGGLSSCAALFGALLVGALLLGSTHVLAAGDGKVSQKLIDGLSSSSTKVRIVAVAAVARSGAPAARSLIEGLLADNEAVVRMAAVDALGVLGDPSALARLEAMNDPDSGVTAARGRAIAKLSALRTVVEVGEPGDYSGAGFTALPPLLRDKVVGAVKDAAGAAMVIEAKGVERGYGLLLNVRALRRFPQGTASMLEVKCEMTIVELPGKILRLSSSAAAAAGVEGALPKSMEAELATDAVNACAPALAKDFLDYAKQHPLRR